MRGITSLIVALGLLGFGGWTYLGSGFNPAVFGAIAGGGFFLFRAYQGIGFSPLNDATTPIEFVTNPTRTIVDCATGELEGFLGENDESKTDEKPTFDPDAIIARYMENRPEAAAENIGPAPAAFGRKGL